MSVDVDAFQVPTHPVRFDVPSVIAAPVNEPSIARLAVPLSDGAPPDGLEVNVIEHPVCVMQSGAVDVSAHPCPLSATE